MPNVTQKDILGARIRRVYEIDLSFDKSNDFQERIIVVELESGLRIPLQQDQNIFFCRDQRHGSSRNQYDFYKKKIDLAAM